MDHTYQRPLQLPACCSVLSAEEMTYTEGGALSINITPEQVMAFGINATVNLLGMMQPLCVPGCSFRYAECPERWFGCW